METGQNCTDCISAKATATRSSSKANDPCKNCEKNNMKTSSRDEKVSRQIRQLCRKNNHHLNGLSAKVKDLGLKANGLCKIEKRPLLATKGSGENKEVKTEDLVECQWRGCERRVDNADLIHHLREEHVDSQRSSEMFVCLWTGCKVFDKSSCSLSWLERHIVTHSGSKPFKCLFDGCGCRFASHCALERHINTHFKHVNQVQQKMAKAAAGTGDSTPSRTTKRRKRKRKLYKDVTGQDYFDNYSLDGVRLGLYRMEQATGILTNNSGPKPSATFQPTVICRRTEPSGQIKHLLRWSPEHILPDTWVTDAQLSRSPPGLSLPVHRLPRADLHNLDRAAYRPLRFRKHRRK